MLFGALDDLSISTLDQPTSARRVVAAFGRIRVVGSSCAADYDILPCSERNDRPLAVTNAIAGRNADGHYFNTDRQRVCCD